MTSLYPSGIPSSSRSSGLRRTAPVATAALWALAAASAVFWALRLSAPADALAPPAATTRLAAEADPAAVARLLGAVPAANAATVTPEAASRFALSGVVAYGTTQGAALISIDGKPPRPWRVGAQLGDGFVLQSVGPRSATLGASVDAAPAFTLQLPVREPIDLGRPATTPSPGMGTGTSIGPGSMPMPMPATLPPVIAPPQ